MPRTEREIEAKLNQVVEQIRDLGQRILGTSEIGVGLMTEETMDEFERRIAAGESTEDLQRESLRAIARKLAAGAHGQFVFEGARRVDPGVPLPFAREPSKKADC